jgi:hypothetical protein
MSYPGDLQGIDSRALPFQSHQANSVARFRPANRAERDDAVAKRNLFTRIRKVTQGGCP